MDQEGPWHGYSLAPRRAVDGADDDDDDAGDPIAHADSPTPVLARNLISHR